MVNTFRSATRKYDRWTLHNNRIDHPFNIDRYCLSANYNVRSFRDFSKETLLKQGEQDCTWLPDCELEPCEY